MSDPIYSERFEAASVSRLDILVFFGAFVGGLAIYWVLHALVIPQRFITAAMVSVMFAYAIAVARVPRLRVRLDQAGDNAYYLGLLFTLFSMAVALYQFSTHIDPSPGTSESGAREIIGNFGIALGTTIAGIFLRVLLHQMRVDPADVESMTRIELAEAATRVKATLDGVSVEMGRLLDDMRQRTSDHLGHLTETVAGTLIDHTSKVTAATTELTLAASVAQREAIAALTSPTTQLTALAAELEAVLKRFQALEAPPLKLASGLEEVSKALGAVAAEAAKVGGQMVEAGEASGRVSQGLADASRKVVEAGEKVGVSQDAMLKRIAEAADRLNEVLEGVGRAVDEDRKGLVLLDDQTRKSVQSANDAQEAAAKVLASLVDLTRGLTEFINQKA